MDSLAADVAAVFRTVITGDRDQIWKAVYDYKEPGQTKDHRYYLYRKKDDDGRNILHYVCMYNTDEVATWMLSLRNDYNHPISKDSDKFGVTAVMYAARTGMIAFVAEWIKQKFDFKTLDRFGRNILHYCCGEGQNIPYDLAARRKYIDNNNLQKVAQLLIINGIDYSRSDQAGEMQYDHVIDITFDKCLSLNTSDTDKAIKTWKVAREIMRRLCPGQIYSPGIATWEANGRLMHLCIAECFVKNAKMNNTQRVEMFEDRIETCEPDINEVDVYRMTALHYLCYYEFDSEPYKLREILVGKMLELGADPNIKDIRGNIPLICAMEKGYVVLPDTNNPEDEDGNGFRKLLRGNADTKMNIDTEKHYTEQIQNVQVQMKLQEETFKEELGRVNEQVNELQKTNALLIKEVGILKTSKEDILNEMPQNLSDHCNEVHEFKSTTKELKREREISLEEQNAVTSSLLLGNFILSDVARHLEADVEVICLPDASLEDLQATVTKNDQTYKNVYLITENRCTSSDLNNLILQYRKLINASKDKATKLIVSSVLPTLDDGDVNDNNDQLNKALEALCQETGSEFVDNDTTFKCMDEATNEMYFDEDGKILSESGVKCLLRNIGVFSTKKKAQATNI